MKSEETGSRWFWSVAKFKNRFFIINDLYYRFLSDGGALPVLSREIDPFWDPEEEVLAGQTVVLLQPVLFSQTVESSVCVVGQEGILGTLQVTLLSTGTIAPVKGQLDVYSLMDRDLSFKIRFNTLQLDTSLYNQVYLKFSLFGETYCSPAIRLSESISADFNHQIALDFPSLSEQQIDHFNQNHVSMSNNL